jgi:uncharacterized protein YbjT (DUF2867 family)
MAEAVAIVAGATGLVSQALVREHAAESHWREVRALVRHALPPELSGPTVVPVQVDYARLDPPPPWAAADHVFCALGSASSLLRGGNLSRQGEWLAPWWKQRNGICPVSTFSRTGTCA